MISLAAQEDTELALELLELLDATLDGALDEIAGGCEELALELLTGDELAALEAVPPEPSAPQPPNRTMQAPKQEAFTSAKAEGARRWGWCFIKVPINCGDDECGKH